MGSLANSSAEPRIALATATAAQLARVAGVGPATAAEIVSFRDERGGVSSIDALGQVAGVGPATLKALRARLEL